MELRAAAPRSFVAALAKPGVRHDKKIWSLMLRKEDYS